MFKEELKEELMKLVNSIKVTQNPSSYYSYAYQFHYNLNDTITSIINLVDKEAIGEDEPEVQTKVKLYPPRIRNQLKAKQRAIIRGNDDRTVD